MGHGQGEERAGRSPPSAGSGPPSAEQVLDALGDAIAVVDASGTILSANARFCEMFAPGSLGPPREISRIAGPYADQAEGLEIEALVSRGTGTIDLTLFVGAGEPTPCTVRITPAGGDGDARVVTIRDTTDRQRLEAELELRSAAAARERELLAAVASTFEEPVLILDEGERLLHANGAACRAFGLVHAEAAGRSLAELDLPRALRGTWLAFLASPRFEETSTVAISCGADRRRVRLSMRRPRNRVGSALGSVLLVGDAASLPAPPEERAALRSAIDHELRTPLASIHGFADALAAEEELEPALRREFGGIVRRESGRLERVVARLLEAVRLDVGADALDRRLLDLHAVVSRAIGELAAAGELEPGSVALQPPARRALAFVDERLIVEAVGELAKHVVMHAASGRVALTVVPGELRHEILFREQEGGAGRRGIRRTDESRSGRAAEHVAERAVPDGEAASAEAGRALRRAAMPGDGGETGLGFYLARRIVALHGGTLRAETAASGGPALAFDLPAR